MEPPCSNWNTTFFSGTGSTIPFRDTTAALSTFYGPEGVAYHESGALFIADMLNNRIRNILINPSGGAVTSTYAGNSQSAYANGVGTLSRFNAPTGIASCQANLYVTDQRSHLVRMIVVATSLVSTIAGSPTISGAIDGVGTNSRFFSPIGIACDTNSLYVADSGNGRVRKISRSTSNVSTLAFGITGVYGVAVDTFNGFVYASSSFNYTLMRISPAGVLSSLAGRSKVRGSSNGVGSSATFDSPKLLTLVHSSLLLVSDTKCIRGG